MNCRQPASPAATKHQATSTSSRFIVPDSPSPSSAPALGCLRRAACPLSLAPCPCRSRYSCRMTAAAAASRRCLRVRQSPLANGQQLVGFVARQPFVLQDDRLAAAASEDRAANAVARAVWSFALPSRRLRQSDDERVDRARRRARTPRSRRARLVTASARSAASGDRLERPGQQAARVADGESDAPFSEVDRPARA